METFIIVIMIIMVSVGMILLLGGIVLLFYGLWLRWYVEPSRRAAQTVSQSEAAVQ